MKRGDKKIEALTKEQTDRFPEFVDKWTRIGLSTEPANRTEAERGVTEAYKIANLPKPKIVWCGSPLSQGITRAIVLSDKLGDSVGDSVRDSVGASVWASVWNSVWASVGASGYGQHDANWIGFYDFFRSACKLEAQTEKLLGIHAN